MAELTPITRIEYYLAKANGQDVPVPQAATRLEMYLRKIAGEEQDVPTPVTRLEMFLAKIAGEDVTTPTPVTRLEMFLDKAAGGSYDDLVAVTRLEMWLDGIQGGETGEQKTASGTAPLSFTALAHALISLTQYGKTVQDGTPTPSSPVDIVCNNGALKMVDDELPSGYTRLQSIESAGTDGYVATGIVLNNLDTDVEVDYQFINTSATQPKMVWGYMDGASNIPRWGFGAYTSGWLGSPNVTASRGSTNSDRHTAIMRVYERGGASYYSGTIDETELYDENALGNVSLFEGNVLPLILFARNNKGTAGNFANAKIFRFSVTEANVLTHDLVPCKDDNGVLGFYDLVTETFLAGTGTLTAGAADYSHAHIGVVGTDEVLWIDDGNKMPPNAVADVLYPVSGSGSCIVSCDVNNGSNVLAVEVHYYKADRTQINYYTLSSYDDATHRMYKSFSLPSTAAYVSVERKSGYSTATVTNLKLAMGATLTPYVTPQTASVTDLYSVGDFADEQNIISGTVTRKCGIWVLTGEENWTVASSNTDVYYLSSGYLPENYGVVSRFTPICSHLEGVLSTVSITAMTENTIKTNNSSKIVYACVGATYATKEAWKDFIAQQYANGTPVIVLYPLAEETTEQVTAQSLHTTAGENVVSVVSNVDPVTLEAVYMGEASDE